MSQLFLYDVLFICCMYLTGVLAVLIAYKIGRRTWKTRFLITIEHNKPRKHYAGQWGEIGSLSMVCLLLFIIDYLTPDALIYSLVSRYPLYTSIPVSIVAIGIIGYSYFICTSVRTKESRGPIYCRRLQRGYVVYNMYSLVMFCTIVLLVVLITYQFHIEKFRFQQSNEAIHQLLMTFQRFRNPTAEMARSHSEVIYGRTLLGATIIMSQIGTLLLITLTVFLAYFMITYTPLSQVYEKAAVKSVHIAFIVSLGFVALMAWYIYFTTYSSFFDRTISQLVTYRPLIESGGGEHIACYNALMLDLHKHRGPTGFILTLTNESGWVVIAIGAVRWLWGRRTTTA